ncbi:MAG: hypothetical protein ABSE62_05010 [Chthoniobacteraceae bacterium]|jgi:hypothetical protein
MLAKLKAWLQKRRHRCRVFEQLDVLQVTESYNPARIIRESQEARGVIERHTLWRSRCVECRGLSLQTETSEGYKSGELA